jgi:tetratricopeptide (TPR) repeat protein
MWKHANKKTFFGLLRAFRVASRLVVFTTLTAVLTSGMGSNSVAANPQSQTKNGIAVNTSASSLEAASNRNSYDTSLLLKAAQYGALEARFSGLQRDYKNRKIDDLALLLAYRDFYDTNPSLELRYAEWIKAYPRSYAAHLAEAIYYVHAGREARGNKYADETSDEQFAAMEVFNSKALADLEKSLTLDDRPILSYVQLIDLDRHNDTNIFADAISYVDRLTMTFFHKHIQSTDSLNSPRDYLDRSNSIDPGNFIARRKYMTILETRWGHSTSEMNAFFKESQSAGLSSERLRVLEALVMQDRAWNEERHGDIQASRKNYVAAVELVGDGNLMEQNMYANLLSDTGFIHEKLRQYDVAKGYFQKSVESYPGDANAWSNLGVCQAHIGDMTSAAVSYKKAAEMGEPIAQNEWGKFLWYGTAVKADHAAAISYFEKSASQGIADAQNNLLFAKQH